MIEKRTTPMHLSSLTALEQQLGKWKSNTLIEEFDSISNETQKSNLMIEFLEKNEGHLLEEIDRVAGIYDRLEEQQNKKVFDLAQKRDQALKLQAEVKTYRALMISIVYVFVLLEIQICSNICFINISKRKTNSRSFIFTNDQRKATRIN